MKSDVVKLQGIIVKQEANAQFRVQVDSLPKDVLCYLAGKISKGSVKPVLGDRVEIEISPLDISRGRISKKL